MRKFPILCGSMLCAMLFCFGVTSAHSQTNPQIYEPGRGKFQLAVGYQYQAYKVFGLRFHNQAFNADFSVHAFDWITGASSRLAVAAEGAAITGFGGNTGGTPGLQANSFFLGGGPHISIQSNSRIEPWIHVLPGWERFRFTQTATLGTNDAFAFLAGAGLDFRFNRAFYWRVQADYIGTHFQTSLQNNYSVGSGLVLYF